MADLRLSGMGGIPFGNTAARPANPVVGTVYYNGQLEIIEIYNGTSWVANSAPPAVPTIVSVTDLGTGLAYATGGTFTVVVAPGSGGSTPLQYNVVTSAGGFSASSNSTTLSLTGLTPNTSFVVSANAQNNFGTTVNSSPFSAVTATTVPQAPTVGTATDKQTLNSGGELSLTFTAGNTGGKSITNYKYSTDGSTYTSLSPAQTTSPLTIPGLNNGTSYAISIKAVNPNGDSIASSTSNSATPSASFNYNYLVVAGGGAGGTSEGGGGGAGGLLTSSATTTTSTVFAITVGAGGSVASAVNSPGNSGVDSSFGAVTASGGGGGGSFGSFASGRSGGSGGGVRRDGAGLTGASGVSGQGFKGGDGIGSSYASAAGGGGAGGVGGNGSANGAGGAPYYGDAASGGAGGVGVASSITGTSIFYAGGGGGSCYQETNSGSQARSAGGNGGGGQGGAGGSAGAPDGLPGTANRGGGGGGGRSGSGGNGGLGAAGGSGVVIIKYPDTRTISIGAGLTGTTATSGSYKVTTITAGTGNVSWT